MIAGNYRLSGQEMMDDAAKWIMDNRPAWLSIETAVRERVSQRRKSSLQALIYIVADECGFKAPDKNLTAAFQRRLMKSVPGYLDCFTVNKSRTDDAE